MQNVRDTTLPSVYYCNIWSGTFTPDVLSGPALPAGPVIVKGMGRHLELKGLARQQQQELEERERRAFKLQVEEARSPYTVRPSCGHEPFARETCCDCGLQVPAPFNLSEGKGKEVIGRSAKQVRTDIPF